MIEVKELVIDKLDDYDKLFEVIDEDYIHNRVIKEFKERIGLKCDKILIEYPYYDKDYLSTYYSYYSKLFKPMNKECYRIHIFKKDLYGGYLTLRPTVSDTKVGKSYINPMFLITEKAYIMLSNYQVNLIGNKYLVSSYPWMYQETDISVCAHVSVWSIIRYYGNKYKDYADKRMMEIVKQTPNGDDRNIPSRGLNLIQIVNILRKNNFHPIILSKDLYLEDEFLEAVYCYLESGIPMVAALTNINHAVSIIGHGKINYDKLDNHIGNIINTCELIDSIIINDDNYFPYLEIKKRNDISNKIQKYDLEDIDYVIVPLYDRMLLVYSDVKKRVYNLIKSKSFEFGDKIVIRIYMTSSKSLKENIKNCKNVNLKLKEIICRLEMPKFIFCVDISNVEEYKNNLISSKIIIDSTCGTYETYPWLLIQDKKNIYFKSRGEYFFEDVKVEPYSIYINNLKEVISCK